MLKLLAGRMHLVMTAVSILHKDKQVNFVETTKVHFREMSEKEIWHYIHHYKPLDKAGSYGAQEWAGMTVMTHIEGDFYNVMGLPVSRLFHHLYHWNND
jgi:septum formation protein